MVIIVVAVTAYRSQLCSTHNYEIEVNLMINEVSTFAHYSDAILLYL